MNLYGLLHFAEGETSSMNSGIRDFAKLAELYARDALTLSRSLHRAGIPFTVLTNDAARVHAILENIGQSAALNVLGLDFHLEFPSGITFYSSHYKLDVFQYLASLEPGSYVGLVDLDMIALGEVPASLTDLIRNKTPLVYDISAQVTPAFGREVILRDMQKLLSTPSEGRWCGGELILGTPEFFAKLHAKTMDIYATYTRIYADLHHQGDEIVTSAALELLRREGQPIADAGALGIAARYWSERVRHPQKPFAAYQDAFLLHLPADKDFLASLSSQEIESRQAFIQKYKRHLRIKQLKRPFQKIKAITSKKL